MRALPVTFAFLATLVIANPALAGCPVNKTKVEKVIASKPELRDGAGAQVARDLRILRDAAIVLDAYEQNGACKRVVAVLNTLRPTRSVLWRWATRTRTRPRRLSAPASRKPQSSKPPIRESCPWRWLQCFTRLA
jgi:hypothetical protein